MKLIMVIYLCQQTNKQPTGINDQQTQKRQQQMNKFLIEFLHFQHLCNTYNQNIATYTN